MQNQEIGCTHDPRKYKGVPMGMYHCPDCGEMVVAGCEHPKYRLDDLPDEFFEGCNDES